MMQAQEQRIGAKSRIGLRERARCGFSMVELLIVVLVGGILTAVAIPKFQSALLNSQMNSTAMAISASVSQTRYSAIMNSQIYTLVYTVAPNTLTTYVVTNVTTSAASPAAAIPNIAILVNGGTAATYTYTFCPNGIVYGAGGICSGNTNAPPALTLTNGGRQENINVSSVGNVQATRVQ
jgi:prepilin-type N-terminal cleavage/methylation domain-containing protein